MGPVRPAWRAAALKPDIFFTAFLSLSKGSARCGKARGVALRNVGLSGPAAAAGLNPSAASPPETPGGVPVRLREEARLGGRGPDRCCGTQAAAPRQSPGSDG